MKRWLFLLLFLPVIAFGQFRMVSSTVTLDSTVNDSTYIIDVDFFSDQTAKGYFASSITADYRVFSQTGQLYDITAASNLTLSSGELTIVEIDNNYVNTESAPVGQILVFDPQGDYITFTPFGNSNMGQVLQQAIGTYNAVVSAEGGSVPEWSGTANYEQFKQVSQDGKIYTNRTGTNTTTPPSSDLVNWELTNKSAILEEIEGRDTISQASHPFSVGDPLWYSGNYILAQDTGASVRVDGIVVEVIDANTFVRQRSGKFTLSSHGFTANIQLYVQPDGSYSAIDTSNSLIYGYSIDASIIEIGVKPDAIRTVANRYNDLLAGRGVDTKQAMLDSLSGFQSFADITSIQTASPTIGYTIEDRSTGITYKIEAIENNYSIDLGGGKYANPVDKTSREFRDIIEFKNSIKNRTIDGIFYAKIGGSLVPITFSPIQVGVDTIGKNDIDGVFLDTVSVEFSGSNEFEYSEEFITFGSDQSYSVSSDRYISAFALAPNNTQTATALYGSGSIDVIIDLVEPYPVIGETWVLSYFVKPKTLSGNLTDRWWYDFSGGSSASGTIQSTQTEWERRYTTVTGTANTQRFRLNITGMSATDTLLVWGFQAERDDGTGLPSFYKKTEMGIPANSGKMYVNLGASLIKNGVLDLGLIGDNSGKYSTLSYNHKAQDDTELIQSAINYCYNLSGSSSSRCNVVQLDKTGYVITDQIEMRDGVILRGAIDKSGGSFANRPLVSLGTTIYVNIADSIKNAINFQVQGANEVIESTGLENINFSIIDTIDKVIYMEEVFKGRFKNISIQPELSSSGKFNYGIYGTGVGSSDLLYNIFEDIDIGSADNTGIYFNKGLGTNEFKGIKISGAGLIGVRAPSGISIEDATIENSGLYAIWTGGRSYIKDIYTEGSGSINTDSTATIRHDDGYLSVSGSSNYHAANGYLFDLRTEYSVDISDIHIGIGNKLRISEGTGKVTLRNWSNVFSNIPITYYILGSEIARRRVTILGTEIEQRNFIGGAMHYDSDIYDASMNEVIINDTTTYSNLILKGRQQNLLDNSLPWVDDTLNLGGPDSLFIYANSFLAPDGTTTAATMKATGFDLGAENIAYLSGLSLSESIQPGDDFTISIWVYPHTNLPDRKFKFRIGSGSSNDKTLAVYAVPNKWSRVYVSGTHPITELATSTLAITASRPQQGNISIADSISIWGVQVEKGVNKPSGYIHTTGSGVNNSNAEITISDPDSILKVIGGVEITGSLIADPSYFFTTGAATPTTDLSGQFSITHGLGDTPTHLSVGNLSGTEYNFEYSCGSTSCTVTVYDGTGTDTTVNSTSISISWAAFR